jgi:transposase-like protein
MEEERTCFECGSLLTKRNFPIFRGGFSWYCFSCRYDYSDDQYESLKETYKEIERMTSSLLLAEGYAFVEKKEEIQLCPKVSEELMEIPEHLSEFFTCEDDITGDDPLSRFGNPIQEI